MATITTERQALVFIAEQLQSLVTESGGSITFEAALSVVTGALVQEGASNYLPGVAASLSLTPRGSLRVQAEEPMPPRLLAGPWQSGAPFSGSPWGG